MGRRKTTLLLHIKDIFQKLEELIVCTSQRIIKHATHFQTTAKALFLIIPRISENKYRDSVSPTEKVDADTGYLYQGENCNKGGSVGNSQMVDSDNDQSIHGQKKCDDHNSVIDKAGGSSESVCDNNPTSFSTQQPTASFCCTSASQNVVGNLLQTGQPDVKKVNYTEFRIVRKVRS